MTKKKKATAAATGVVAMALLFAGSFAWVSTMQTATNKFKKADYNVVLHDVFEGKEVVTNDSATGEYTSETMNWTDEKDTLDKDIWVTNNGSGDILVRMKLLEDINANDHGTVFEKKETATVLTGANENRTYGTNTKPIHDYVEWKIGDEEWSQSTKIMTYDEWCNLTDPTDKIGAYWLIDADGYIYWMQPLEPTAQTDRTLDKAGEKGNTALLLDAVTLLKNNKSTNDPIKGHVDYSIKVEMSAIDADLDGFYQEGSPWGSKGMNGRGIVLAIGNADRVKTLKAKRDAIPAEYTSVKNLYNDAINQALAGGTEYQIAVLEEKADKLQELLASDPTYMDPAITEGTEPNTYKLTDTAETPIDTVIATYISRLYDNKEITALTKADLAGVGSIDMTNQGVQSLSGLTAAYFPNLTTIKLTSESGIDMNDVNNMDEALKPKLQVFTLFQCTNVAGNVDMTKFSGLQKLSLRACTKITGLTGLPSGLDSLNAEQSQIRSLDVSNCTLLRSINLYGCTSLGLDSPTGEITGLENLEELRNINVKLNKNLKKINVGKSNYMVNFTAEKDSELTEVIFAPEAFNHMDSYFSILLNIKSCPKLESLNISNMSLINELSIVGCTKLLEDVNANVTKKDTQTLITK